MYANLNLPQHQWYTCFYHIKS